MKSLMWAVVAVCMVAGLAFAADEAAPASTFTGTVVAKAADAAADVVAVLKVGEKAMNLMAADDAVKAQIVALVGKEAVVTGKAEGDNVKVATIAEKKAGA